MFSLAILDFRYRIRGIKHLVFYELPVYAQFYPEIVNFMESDPDISVTVCVCFRVRSRYFNHGMGMFKNPIQIYPLRYACVLASDADGSI